MCSLLGKSHFVTGHKLSTLELLVEIIHDIQENVMNNHSVVRLLFWMLSFTLLVTTSACSSSPGTVLDSTTYWEDESNNSSSQANVMSLNYSAPSTSSNFTGIISAADPSDDWFRVTTTQAGQLSVTLTGYDIASNEHMQIELMNSSLNLLDDKFINTNNGNIATVISAANSQPGTYYARISSDKGAHRYDLDPDFTSGGAATAYWEVEDNDSTSLADVMALNYNPDSDGYDYTGVIAAEDTSDDWFRLITTRSGRLAVTLSNFDLSVNQSIYITLYNSKLLELDTRFLSGASGNSSVTASTAFGLPAGDYYVRISSDSWTHQYNLTPVFSQ